MEQNVELQHAWDFVEHTGRSIFLTGKAGTGKTTFLKSVVEHSSKRSIVVAPTGVAAINAGGMTIHSFFQLPFSPFVPGAKIESRFDFGKEKRKIIASLDLLIIDEISMVRSDLLDAIDSVLRRFRDRYQPFGGVQLLMIGDLQQLTPVVTPEDERVLAPYYDTADLGSLLFRRGSYIDMAKPFKAYEYLGHELPVISTKGTAIGTFCERYDFGWNIAYSAKAIQRVFREIFEDPALLAHKQRNCKIAKAENLWTCRAEQVARDLVK